MTAIAAGAELKASRLSAIGPTIVRRTSDGIVTNSTALVDGLSVAVLANTVYEVDATLIYEATTGNDIRVGMNWPSGTLAWGALGLDVAATTWFGDVRTASFGSAAVDQVTSLGGAGAGNQLIAIARGLLAVGATGGNLRLRFAQNVAAASTSAVLKAGTILKITAV